MKKLRTDSKWHSIPPHAREAVAKWLFDEGMGYAAALKRAEQEFGIKSSVSGIARFYRHVADTRELAGLNIAPANSAEFRNTLRKLVASAAYNAGICYDPRRLGKNFVSLAKLVLQQGENDLKGRRLELEMQKAKRRT